MAGIKSILFPTDFSANAEKALDCAVQIAGVFKADILILHCYTPYSLPFDTEKLRKMEMESQEQRIKRSMAETESAIYRNNKNIVTERIVRSGKVPEVVRQICRERKTDLIIMGTKGASGLKEVILGTNTADVISDSGCPVLAVPEKPRFSGIRRIVYASEFSREDETRKLKTVDMFLSKFGSELILLDLRSETQEQKLETLAGQEVKHMIRNADVKAPCSKKQDKENCIREFLQEHPADILCLSRKKKFFPETILGSDYVMELSYHSELPVLVLPQ